MTARGTAEPTTATEAVLETWCAGPTTVSSSVSTFTPRTTAVRGRAPDPNLPQHRQVRWRECGRSLLQARSAADGTTRAGGAALQRVPVMSARATVTARLTADFTTATGAAGLVWCVAATTVGSSEPTSTRRTTAVNCPVVLEVRLT